MIEIDKFAENVKAIRESKKMTQKDLAEKVGITPATISAYEKKLNFLLWKMLY